MCLGSVLQFWEVLFIDYCMTHRRITPIFLKDLELSDVFGVCIVFSWLKNAVLLNKCVDPSCGSRETVSDIPAGRAGRPGPSRERCSERSAQCQRGVSSLYTRCASQRLVPAPMGIPATLWLTAVRHSERVRLKDPTGHPFDWPFRRAPRTKRTKRNLSLSSLLIL